MTERFIIWVRPHVKWRPNKPDRHFELRLERYEPGADTGKGMLRHPGQEAGIVVSGELELTVGEETETLGIGRWLLL